MLAPLRWVLLVSALPALCAAQAASPPPDSVPDVASLRAPSTPAFVLLGISPTDVARPQTPGDLALGFVNKASGVTTLPEDLAIEVSPYWLVQHQRTTWEDDITRSVGTSIARTLALSIASTEKGSDPTRSTDLGLGARAMILSGTLSDTTRKLLRAVEENAAREGHIFNRYRQEEAERIDSRMSLEMRPCLAIADPDARATCAGRVVVSFQPQRDSLTRAVRANPQYQAEIAKAEKTLDNFSLVREGLLWEVAGGVVYDFAGGAWANKKRARSGAWTTLSYEGGKLGQDTRWTPILVARYLKEDTTASLNIFDVGGRLVASGQQYALSVELVHRFWSGDNAPSSQHRVSGMLEYKLRDDAWLFGAVGRDYAEASRDSFITRFGVSLSLRKERYKPKT